MIRRIFDRIEEETLSEGDKAKLLDVIVRIRDDQENSLETDLYIAHYFSKVVEVIRGIWEKERSITQFVSVINQYLEGKTIVYNETKYELRIILENKKEIDLKNLSSGEKQVVSLLAHLYLADVDKYFVIIDEPELSLSVPWQTRFLPDILASGHCDFLAAVTHSPFIFENALDKHTVDLRDCISG
jgi:hypothetical protein